MTPRLGHEVPVEVASLGGLGVDEQASTADLLAKPKRPGNDVLEQTSDTPVVLDYM